MLQMLECRLNDEEVRSKGEELADCDHQLDDLLAEKAEALKAFKSRLAQIEERIETLVTEIRSHKGTRAVECEEVADFPAGVVRLIRKDTREEVSNRPVTDKDRQLVFPALAPVSAVG